MGTRQAIQSFPVLWVTDFYVFNQGTYTTDPETGSQLYKDTNDGMVYEWDKAKNAWFPRIDEDFMAVYQMNYGFTPEGK